MARRERRARRAARRGARTASTLATLAALSMLACSDDVLGPVCTGEFRYGLSITVRGASGAPAAEGSVGTAVDGEHEETLQVFGPATLVGAGERPGTYDITITRPGFETWSAEGVTVTADECHVHPVSLEANLIPAS